MCTTAGQRIHVAQVARRAMRFVLGTTSKHTIMCSSASTADLVLQCYYTPNQSPSTHLLLRRSGEESEDGERRLRTTGDREVERRLRTTGDREAERRLRTTGDREVERRLRAATGDLDAERRRFLSALSLLLLRLRSTLQGNRKHHVIGAVIPIETCTITDENFGSRLQHFKNLP